MADLAVRTQIVGADQVARVDVGLLDELVDPHGAITRTLVDFIATSPDLSCFKK